MKISVIASGSNGNSCLVEHKTTSVLIDAGKSGKQIEERMAHLGKYPENIDAIIFNIPLYMSKQTFAEARFKIGNAEIKQFNKTFRIRNLEIKPIATSHKVNSYGFGIGDFGLFTDTGKINFFMKN